jgi:hypothetical protein
MFNSLPLSQREYSLPRGDARRSLGLLRFDLLLQMDPSVLDPELVTS